MTRLDFLLALKFKFSSDSIKSLLFDPNELEIKRCELHDQGLLEQPHESSQSLSGEHE